MLDFLAVLADTLKTAFLSWDLDMQISTIVIRKRTITVARAWYDFGVCMWLSDIKNALRVCRFMMGLRYRADHRLT